MKRLIAPNIAKHLRKQVRFKQTRGLAPVNCDLISTHIRAKTDVQTLQCL